MFIEERHEKILELLHADKRVEVVELSKLFNISEDSIRRDLRLMEEKGLVNRTYGGAVLPTQVSSINQFSDRNKINTSGKDKIAKKAAFIINDGDTILLDGSTTSIRLTPFLNNFKNLTVITNCIAIAHEITNSVNGIKLFVLGGIVQKENSNTFSIDTLNAIKELKADKAFIAPCSISSNRGLSSSSLEEAPIKKAMLDTGREIYILADSHKFGKDAVAFISPIKPEFTIITDISDRDSTELEFKNHIDKGLKFIFC